MMSDLDQDQPVKTGEATTGKSAMMKYESRGGLVPTSFDEAFRMARAFAASGMVPKAYTDKPEAVFVAMQMGAELGIPPLQAVQNIAVINGKPGVYGDMGKALLLAAGCIIDEDDIDAIQKNGRARCKITRPGRPPVERTFSIENAKTAGLWAKDGPWKTYPFRQMAWRAFWFAARDGAADLLKGMRGAEELVDYPPEREVEGKAEFVEQPKRVQKPEAHSADGQEAASVATGASRGAASPVTSSAPQGADDGGTRAPAAGTVSSTASSPAGAEPNSSHPAENVGMASAPRSEEHKAARQPDPTTPVASTQSSSPDTTGSNTGDDQTSASTVENGREPGSDDEQPPAFVDDGGPRLTHPQCNILKRRMEGAALTLVDLRSKFKLNPDQGLEDLPAAAFNAVQIWIKSPF